MDKHVIKSPVSLEDMDVQVYVRGSAKVSTGQVDVDGKLVYEVRKCWGNKTMTLAEIKKLLGGK